MVPFTEWPIWVKSFSNLSFSKKNVKFTISSAIVFLILYVLLEYGIIPIDLQNVEEIAKFTFIILAAYQFLQSSAIFWIDRHSKWEFINNRSFAQALFAYFGGLLTFFTIFLLRMLVI